MPSPAPGTGAATSRPPVAPEPSGARDPRLWAGLLLLLIVLLAVCAVAGFIAWQRAPVGAV